MPNVQSFVLSRNEQAQFLRREHGKQFRREKMALVLLRSRLLVTLLSCTLRLVSRFQEVLACGTNFVFVTAFPTPKRNYVMSSPLVRFSLLEIISCFEIPYALCDDCFCRTKVYRLQK